ncbi:MAG: response regulator transcription factor [Culturomica sp.]|jgi:two-component system alkaline phosphatase synthesis response regulator PhoP|nr:response regulator transcription factor [Culturomica sp.]
MNGKITVLYAEDNSGTASLIKMMLERNSFVVTVEPDGERAIERYRAGVPDLLLLDIEMPGKSGLEVVSVIRRENRLLPIVLFSSFVDPAIELEAIHLGADDCIRKDCPPELFIAKLHNILRRVYNKQSPSVYQLSEVTEFNSRTCALLIDGRPVKLKTKEAELLKLLCTRMNDWAEKEYLIMGLWGRASLYKERVLRKLVSALRNRLSEDKTVQISNKYGEAYSLVSELIR